LVAIIKRYFGPMINGTADEDDDGADPDLDRKIKWPPFDRFICCGDNICSAQSSEGHQYDDEQKRREDAGFAWTEDVGIMVTSGIVTASTAVVSATSAAVTARAGCQICTASS
jgi:hypothetical protein